MKADVLTELPKGMVLISQEHYDAMYRVYVDALCVESVKRSEKRRKNGTEVYHKAEDVFKKIEAKHGFKL